MFKYIILFLCAAPNLLFAQSDSLYDFMLPSFKIYRNENGKNVCYNFEKKWNLVTVQDSFLLADPNKYSYKSNLHDITKISFHSGSDIKKAAIITGIVGFGLGFLVGGAEISPGGGSEFIVSRAFLGGILGGIVFGFIGGTVSALVGKDEIYDLNITETDTKKLKIIEILKKNSIKK